jgi:hypothetical protein
MAVNDFFTFPSTLFFLVCGVFLPLTLHIYYIIFFNICKAFCLIYLIFPSPSFLWASLGLPLTTYILYHIFYFCEAPKSLFRRLLDGTRYTRMRGSDQGSGSVRRDTPMGVVGKPVRVKTYANA